MKISLPFSSLCLTLVLFSFLLNDSLCLQSLYSEARNVRTLRGHDQALPIYQEILKRNPNDMTAATRIAADEESTERHVAFGTRGSRSEKLRFVELLESFGFNGSSISDLVFATDDARADRAKRSSAPLFLQALRAGTQSPPIPNCPLGACIQLLLLAVCLPEKTCVDLLGSEFVELLETLSLAYVSHAGDGKNTNGLLIPYIHVCPVTVGEKTLFLATDLHPNVLSITTIGGNKDTTSTTGSSMDDDGAVMYIGPDSLSVYKKLYGFLNSIINDG